MGERARVFVLMHLIPFSLLSAFYHKRKEGREREKILTHFCLLFAQKRGKREEEMARDEEQGIRKADQ